MIFKRSGVARSNGNGKFKLPLGIMSGDTVEAISYKDALTRIQFLKNSLIERLSHADRSEGRFLFLSSYVLALCAQEAMIASVNDELIASDIPWDSESCVPTISSTVGDIVSYAERLKEPKDHFLKALLLSFSGWTLLSTEQKECACGNGKLREISIDILVNTNIQITSPNVLNMEFFVGIQSDDQAHLERHYSFKKQSVRQDNLIIIFSSGGIIFKDDDNIYKIQPRASGQAEQFRANKMTEILDGLISSFVKEA